jgi:hypothetical protein
MEQAALIGKSLRRPATGGGYLFFLAFFRLSKYHVHETLRRFRRAAADLL